MSDNLAWRELSRSTLYHSPYGRHVDDVIYQLPNGQEDHFHLKVEGTYAIVLALTAEQQVVMVRQFRPGKNSVLTELPGGGIKATQTPEQAAAAELLEETGYAGELEFVTEEWPDGYSDRRAFIFVARNCVKVAEQTLDPTEFLEVTLLSVDELRTHLRTGKLTDVGAGYLALDYLGLL